MVDLRCGKYSCYLFQTSTSSWAPQLELCPWVVVILVIFPARTRIALVYLHRWALVPDFSGPFSSIRCGSLHRGGRDHLPLGLKWGDGRNIKDLVRELWANQFFVPIINDFIGIFLFLSLMILLAYNMVSFPIINDSVDIQHGGFYWFSPWQKVVEEYTWWIAHHTWWMMAVDRRVTVWMAIDQYDLSPQIDLFGIPNLGPWRTFRPSTRPANCGGIPHQSETPLPSLRPPLIPPSQNPINGNFRILSGQVYRTSFQA